MIIDNVVKYAQTVHFSVIINAAELMLIKYDFKISNRYKLIRYEDDDATAKLKIGQNHFVEITLPGVAAMLSFILFVLLCSRYDNKLNKNVG